MLATQTRIAPLFRGWVKVPTGGRAATQTVGVQPTTRRRASDAGGFPRREPTVTVRMGEGEVHSTRRASLHVLLLCHSPFAVARNGGSVAASDQRRGRFQELRRRQAPIARAR